MILFVGLRQHTERFHKVELDSCKPMKKRELRECESEAQQCPADLTTTTSAPPNPTAVMATTDPTTAPNSVAADTVATDLTVAPDEMQTEETYPKNNVYFR